MDFSGLIAVLEFVRRAGGMQPKNHYCDPSNYPINPSCKIRLHSVTTANPTHRDVFMCKCLGGWEKVMSISIMNRHKVLLP